MWTFQLDNLQELQTTFDRLLDKKQVLDAARPLPNSALYKIKESLSVEWTYNSNSIEGNTLTLQETHMVLQEGITIKGKSLREHFEAFNHDKALDLVYELADKHQKLSAKDIMNVHALVLRSIEDDYAGRFRNGGVRISGANFSPPNARKVPDLIDELIAFTNDNPLELNDIVLATIFHHKFVWIHPFFDGNGRTVRLMMNLLLMRKGFPPAIILKTDRKKYYLALNTANKGDYSKLALLMAQSLERTLNIYLSVLPSTEEEYLPIGQLVEEPELPYGQEYISLLARQGKIDAYKEGRTWMTSKKAILDYMNQTVRKDAKTTAGRKKKVVRKTD
jgi:Fic family protein